MTEKVKNNGFCDFFFLHGAEPSDQQNVTFCSFGFFSFIGKDLDKEATCHRNLFPFLCVCVCVQQNLIRAAPSYKEQSMCPPLGAQ